MKNKLFYAILLIVLACIDSSVLAQTSTVQIKHDRIIFPDNSEQTTSNSIWKPVEEYQTVDINTDREIIQAAINSGNQVSLTPNKIYYIDGSLEIGQFQYLYIPRSSTLVFDAEGASYAAVIMDSRSTLEGDGRIVSSRFSLSDHSATWNMNNKKAGIRLTGHGIKVEIGWIGGFEYGFDVGGSYEIAGCNVYVRQFVNNLYCFLINSYGGGFVNQNYFHWDSASISDNCIQCIALRSYTYGIYMDGEGEPNNNTFSGGIEEYHIAVRLSGRFNRFMGIRAEHCDYTFQIVGNNTLNTSGNTIFGEYGNNGEFYSKILNSQGDNRTIQDAVQIYGPEGKNLLHLINATSVSATNNVSATDMYAYNFWNLSDGTLKKEISSVDDALDKIISLRGVKFKFESAEKVEKKGKGNDKESKYNYGFIAQEVKETLPELVRLKTEDSLYVVNYIGVIPILVEAFKDQKKNIDSLNARISYLEELLNSSIQLLQKSGSAELIPESKPEVTIYPNPNDGNFYLKSVNCIPDNIIISNSSGQVMFEETNITSDYFPLNLAGLHRGIYHAVIKVNDQIITRRIIKDR